MNNGKSIFKTIEARNPKGKFSWIRRGRRSFRRPYRARAMFSLIAFLWVFCPLSWPFQGQEPTAEILNLGGGGNLVIPAEYGGIIYRYNEESPNQIYIIGMNHRDALTRLNGSNTAKAQAEAYKIGEWLVRNEGLELILPEGFFEKKGGSKTKAVSVKAAASRPAVAVEPQNLESIVAQLSDETRYVNAEMLLKQNFLLRIQQVEDEALYDAVGERLMKLSSGNNTLYESMCLKSEVDFLQEKRTAAMLQSIPERVAKEFGDGTIKKRKALFTIGLSHIPDIVNYLKENKIKIYCPLYTTIETGNYIADLKLAKEGFGVTVIIPKTVADDREVLSRTGVDKVVAEYGSRSLTVSREGSESL